MHQFTALAFPSHPDAFGSLLGVEQTRTMEEVECAITMTTIELLQALFGCRQDRVIIGHVLFGCVGKVAQDTEDDIAVPVCEVVYFKLHER